MTLFILSCVLLLLAAIPALLCFRNRSVFLPATKSREALNAVRDTPISILMPARNEASSIGAAIESIMRSDHSNWELLILNDHSEDDTASIVTGFAERDPRIRLIESAPLPTDWNGKQHACWQLANQAQYPVFLFLDADVRLKPDATSRLLAQQHASGVPLISGFPFQETGTILEKLLIPMMHYVLLGYLPIDRMRQSNDPSFAAGCGQLFLAVRSSYFQASGHAAIRDSRHDGIKLPRAFRRAGLATDIFDASDIATCRMYRSALEVCRGILKNATEGIASPKLIGPFTCLLLGGSVLPVILLPIAIANHVSGVTCLILVMATLLGWWPRVWAAAHFRQSWLGACLHPIAVLLFINLQWCALLMKLTNLKLRWRGRT